MNETPLDRDGDLPVHRDGTISDFDWYDPHGQFLDTHRHGHLLDDGPGAPYRPLTDDELEFLEDEDNSDSSFRRAVALHPAKGVDRRAGSPGEGEPLWLRNADVDGDDGPSFGPRPLFAGRTAGRRNQAMVVGPSRVRRWLEQLAGRLASLRAARVTGCERHGCTNPATHEMVGFHWSIFECDECLVKVYGTPYPLIGVEQLRADGEPRSDEERAEIRRRFFNGEATDAE